MKFKVIFYTLHTGQQLHVVGLEPAPREKCEEESEVAANTICTQEKLEGAECKVCDIEMEIEVQISMNELSTPLGRGGRRGAVDVPGGRRVAPRRRLGVAQELLQHCTAAKALRQGGYMEMDCIQGSAKRLWPGCVNAPGKMRQRWQATAGTKFIKLG